MTEDTPLHQMTAQVDADDIENHISEIQYLVKELRREVDELKNATVTMTLGGATTEIKAEERFDINLAVSLSVVDVNSHEGATSTSTTMDIDIDTSDDVESETNTGAGTATATATVKERASDDDPLPTMETEHALNADGGEPHNDSNNDSNPEGEMEAELEGEEAGSGNA